MGTTNPGLPGRSEKQIWGSPSLSTLGSGLAGPAQKEKDTSASDNEWFIFLEGWGGGEKSRGLPPISPPQQALPTRTCSQGWEQTPRLGHQPMGPGGDAL